MSDKKQEEIQQDPNISIRKNTMSRIEDALTKVDQQIRASNDPGELLVKQEGLAVTHDWLVERSPPEEKKKYVSMQNKLRYQYASEIINKGPSEHSKLEEKEIANAMLKGEGIDLDAVVKAFSYS